MQYQGSNAAQTLRLHYTQVLELRRAFYAKRMVRELSREDVADLIDVKWSRIQDFERGKVRNHDPDFLDAIQDIIAGWDEERRLHDAGIQRSERLAIADKHEVRESDFPLPENFDEALVLADA